MNAEKLPSKIGEYTVESKLGEGAMGVVYKASVGDLIVAIKVISPEISGDREFVQRFLREMQVVSTLDHPNIVKAVDFGVDVSQNMYFVALEFIDGKSLKDLLVQQKRLSLEDSLNLTKMIAQGLEYAYNHGIVHRDIKPDNILLTSGKQVKITDFGLVKSQSQSSITQTGAILGTPFYLAPEQAFADKKIDIRADLYSLGITFYHMLCGRPPFVFENPMKVITSHCYTPLPPVTDFVQNVPLPILQLIDKMTEKDRDKRFETPGQVIEAISSFQANGQIPNLALSSKGQQHLEEAEYEDAPTRMFQGEVPPPSEELSPKKSTVKLEHRPQSGAKRTGSKVKSKIRGREGKPQSGAKKTGSPNKENKLFYIAAAIALVIAVLGLVVVALVLKQFKII